MVSLLETSSSPPPSFKKNFSFFFSFFLSTFAYSPLYYFVPELFVRTLLCSKNLFHKFAHFQNRLLLLGDNGTVEVRQQWEKWKAEKRKKKTLASYCPISNAQQLLETEVWLLIILIFLPLHFFSSPVFASLLIHAWLHLFELCFKGAYNRSSVLQLFVVVVCFVFFIAIVISLFYCYLIFIVVIKIYTTLYGIPLTQISLKALTADFPVLLDNLF